MQNFSIENKYDIICKLGVGSQGMVYKVKNKQTSRIVAVKIQNGISQREYKILEMIMLKKFNHIIEIITIEQQNNGQTLIEMELGEQNFFELMQSNEFKTFTHEKKNEYFIQMLKAVKEFHETNSFHRDLKPENFVLCGGQLKLIDFGISKENQNFNQTMHVGTCLYMAPEVQKGTNYNKLVDIWALGCIWFEILTGNTFFYGNSNSEVCQQILNFNQSQINDRINKENQLLPKEKEILQKSLQIEPFRRLQIIDFINQLNNLQNPQQQQAVKVYPFNGIQSNQLPFNPNQFLQHNQCIPNQVPIVFQKLQVNQNNFGIIFPNQNPLIQQPQPQNNFQQMNNQQQQLKNQGFDQKKQIQIQISNPPFQLSQNQPQNQQQNQQLLNGQQKQVEVKEEDIEQDSVDNIQQQENQDLIIKQKIKEEYEIKFQEELANIREKEKMEYQIKLKADKEQQQKEFMLFKDQFQSNLNIEFEQKEFKIKFEEGKLRFYNTIQNHLELLEKFEEYFKKIQTDILNSDQQKNQLTKSLELIKEIQLELEEQKNIAKQMELSISQFLTIEEFQLKQELFTNNIQKFYTRLFIKLNTNDEEIRKLLMEANSDNLYLRTELVKIINGLQQNMKQETFSLEKKLMKQNSEIQDLDNQFQKQNFNNCSQKLIKLKSDQNQNKIILQEITVKLEDQSKKTIIEDISNFILMSQKVNSIRQTLDQTEYLITDIQRFMINASQLMQIDSKNKSEYQFYKKLIQQKQFIQIQYSKQKEFKNLPKLFEQTGNLLSQDIDDQMLSRSFEIQFSIMKILSEFSQQIYLEQQDSQQINNVEKKKQKSLDKFHKNVDQLKKLHFYQNCKELQETTSQLENEFKEITSQPENVLQQINQNQTQDHQEMPQQFIEKQYKDLKNKSNKLVSQQIQVIDSLFYNQSKVNTLEFNQKELFIKYYEKITIRPKKIIIYFEQIQKFSKCLVEIEQEYQVTRNKFRQEIHNYQNTFLEEFTVQLCKSANKSLDQIEKQIQIFQDAIKKIDQFFQNQKLQQNYLNSQNNLDQCENIRQKIQNIPFDTFSQIFEQSKNQQSSYYRLQCQIIEIQNFLFKQLINKKDIVQYIISKKQPTQIIQNQFEQFKQETQNLMGQIFCSQNNEIKAEFDFVELYIEDTEQKIIKNDCWINKLGEQFVSITKTLKIENSLEKKLRQLFLGGYKEN